MVILLVLMYVFLLFENCFKRFVPFVSYFDEILTIILLSLAFLKFIGKKRGIIYKKIFLDTELKSVKFWIIAILIGIISTVTFKLQINSEAVYKDILAMSKFVICYISAIYLSNTLNKEKLLHYVSKISKIFIIIIFFSGVISLFVDIGLSRNEYRYGIRVFRFLFTHPTFMVSSIVVMLAVIQAKSKNIINIYSLQALAVLIMSMRNKAFVVVIAFIVFAIINKFKNENLKNQWKYTVFIILGSLYVSYDKIMQYISWGINAARPALYIVGYQIAKDYFPFGSGFGTFGTFLSGEYYSPLYFEYGINDVSGIQENDYSYIADTFFPGVYAQFGFLGAIFFIGSIILILMSSIKRYRDKNQTNISVYLLIIYIFAASTAESFLTNTTGCVYALILALYMGKAVDIQPKAIITTK